MVRIGILSDTHYMDAADGYSLVQYLKESVFRDVEFIVHAGDMVDSCFSALLAPLPVYAVRGNMDPASNETPVKRLLTIEGCRIGVAHGWGQAEGLAERLLKEFSDDDLDILVFGHSHVPCCYYQGKTLVLNPGSPTRPRDDSSPSVALLTVDGALAQGEIVPVPVGDKLLEPLPV